ncbi:MAG: cytochrome-c peroxidase, partial [Bacteroidota bacterium]
MRKSMCLIVGWSILFISCSAKDDAVAEDPYAFRKPENFPDPTYTFENNPITKEGFELGRKLFFDPILSRDNTVSCNNCHQQVRAFADTPAHPRSIGIANRMGIRNAPALANMAFFPEFFWDGGVTHLDFVPINAIESPVEMDDQLANVIEKLNAHSEYPERFRQAFGIEEITSPFMLFALSQFTNRMVSANSPYDQYIRGEGVTPSDLELEGQAIFEEKCATCHAGTLFTDFSYRNNGLNGTFTDLGRGGITELEADHG